MRFDEMFEFDLFSRGDWLKLTVAAIALFAVLGALIWWIVDATLSGKLTF